MIKHLMKRNKTLTTPPQTMTKAASIKLCITLATSRTSDKQSAA
jgi:hypothetical protein